MIRACNVLFRLQDDDVRYDAVTIMYVVRRAECKNKTIFVVTYNAVFTQNCSAEHTIIRLSSGIFQLSDRGENEENNQRVCIVYTCVINFLWILLILMCDIESYSCDDELAVCSALVYTYMLAAACYILLDGHISLLQWNVLVESVIIHTYLYHATGRLLSTGDIRRKTCWNGT